MVEAEADVIAAAIRFAKRNGILYERNHKGFGAEAGWPDHNFYFYGAHLFKVEFKRTGKEAEKLQEHRIKDLRRRGFDVAVIDSTHGAREALAQRLDAQPRSGGSRPAHDDVRDRGPVGGSGSRQDIHYPSVVLGPLGAGAGRLHARRGPSAGVPACVAPRGEEVEPVSPPQRRTSAWGKKGSDSRGWPPAGARPRKS